MADEIKTILKIGGDASEAVKAADQAAAAIDKAAAAQRKASAESAAQDLQRTAMAGTSGPDADSAAALEQLAEREREAADEAVELGKSVKGSSRELNMLGELISGVDPRLGMLVRSFAKVRELAAGALTPAALGVAGAAAGIGVVILAFQKVNEAVDEATRKLNDFAAAQERVRQGARQLEKEVAGSAAKAGLSVEALGGARSLAGRIESKGIERGAAVGAAPFLVDDQGNQIVSDEEAMLLTAGIQAGKIDPMEGDTPAKRARALERARKQFSRNEPAVRAAAAQYAAEESRVRAAAAAGGVTEIGQLLEREEGLTGEAAQERAQVISRQIKEGGPKREFFMGVNPITMKAWGFDKETIPGPFLDMFGAPEIQTEESDPLIPNIRRRAATSEAAPKQLAGQSQGPAVVHNHYGPSYMGNEGSQFARFPRQ